MTINYIIHAPGVGRLCKIFNENILRTQFCRYSQKKGIWFNILPKMEDELFTYCNHFMSRESYLFHHDTNLLVFNENYFYKQYKNQWINVNIKLYNNIDTRSIPMASKYIQYYFNHSKHLQLYRNELYRNGNFKLNRPITNLI